MYLTRMALNPARRETRRLMSSRQRLHAAVLASAPPQPADTGRMLWRLDRTGPEHTLYLAGPTRPDLTHLVEQAGWPTTEGWETRDYGPFLSRLTTGQQWHFRLTGNPVRQVSRPGERSRFQGARTPTQAQDWLVRRQERWGFTVTGNNVPSLDGYDGDGLDVVVSELGPWTFDKGEDGRGRRRLTVTSATFEGTLQVTDPELLRAALATGMGRARGYGCGLMTLAPTGP